MKRNLLLAVISMAITVAIVPAAIPISGSQMVLRAGSGITVTSSPAWEASRPGVHFANTTRPAYIQNLLQPLPAGKTVHGASLVRVATMTAGPEKRFLLPPLSLIPHLGMKLTVGVFFKEMRYHEVRGAADAAPVEKSTAGLIIGIGDNRSLTVRMSGWLGVIGAGRQEQETR